MIMDQDATNRILVSGFSNHLAGTEAVIRNYVYATQDILSFDFLVWEEPTNYSELFEGTRNRYFVIPRKSVDLFGYQRGMKQFFESHQGEYSALWSSMCNLSNIDYLRYARSYGIERRIIHAHCDSYLGAGYNVLLSRLHRKEALELANERWACSRLAGDFFFGDLGYELVTNAVDPSRFTFSAAKRASFRECLGIPADAFVFGAVGTLNERKNHAFLINVLKIILETRANSYLLIVGDGELRDVLMREAENLGLSEYVVLAGQQTDMSLALSAFDVFAFPSLHEGLPMAVVEAQFNGLPCVISDQVSGEVSITPRCTFAPLNDPGVWAEAILAKDGERFDVTSTEMGSFDINVSAGTFLSLMRDGCFGNC